MPRRSTRQLPADSVARFFAFARARHSIYIARAAGRPAPWTDDSILREYRFTNVFRELDRTTQWFTKYVRQPLREKPEVLLATVLFRWFNRISTGEAIFCQTELEHNTAWEHFLRTGETHIMREAIVRHCGDGPYVTGSYIVQTTSREMRGLSKLDGVLKLVQKFHREERLRLSWGVAANNLLHARGRGSLQTTFRWLTEFPSMGPFMAYEVVSDLRHTALHERAVDVMAWANMGPGARRGIWRIMGWDFRRHPVGHSDEEFGLLAMRELLDLSRFKKHWPDRWPVWEMREVEHTLCEFDKYERARLGEGRPRQKFTGGANHAQR